MNKEEVEAVIDSFGADLPERLTGNEENEIVAKRMADLVKAERVAVVDLLRDWIGVRIAECERQSGDGRREGSMFLALEVARRYKLNELRPDIEELTADIKAGKTFLPHYAEIVSKFLRDLSDHPRTAKFN
jgi:hypothetical protein